jgi:hypothetical protein
VLRLPMVAVIPALGVLACGWAYRCLGTLPPPAPGPPQASPAPGPAR